MGAPKKKKRPDTNILITRFNTTDGEAKVIDYMPVGNQSVPGKCSKKQNCVIRKVSVQHKKNAPMAFRMQCHPAFNYARDHHSTLVTSWGAYFASGKHNTQQRMRAQHQRRERERERERESLYKARDLTQSSFCCFR